MAAFPYVTLRRRHADLGAALGNTASRLWTMRNGYALATQRGLAEIAQRLQAESEARA